MIVDFRPGLRHHILSDTAVTALISRRFFPIVIPPGTTLPAAVYSQVSGLGDHTMSGPSGLTQSRLQIDVYDKNTAPQRAMNIANAIKNRIDGMRGWVGIGAERIKIQGVFYINQFETSEDGIFRIMREYMVHYSER